MKRPLEGLGLAAEPDRGSTPPTYGNQSYLWLALSGRIFLQVLGKLRPQSPRSRRYRLSVPMSLCAS